MTIVWMSLSVISFALFANFIVESTKIGGNTQLYIPAWVVLGMGLVFAILAYFAQREIDRKDGNERQKREERAQKRENRAQERFRQETKMFKYYKQTHGETFNDNDEENKEST